MKKVKIRFNLGRGENYMKWRIEYKSQNKKSVNYINPSDVQLIMKDCVLKNNKSTATKIYSGDNKSVCAWILCDEIQIRYIGTETIKSNNPNNLNYNPRINPFWVLGKETNVDNHQFKEIITEGKKLYVKTF